MTHCKFQCVLQCQNVTHECSLIEQKDIHVGSVKMYKANNGSPIFVYFTVGYKCKHGSLTQFWGGVRTGCLPHMSQRFLFFPPGTLALCSCFSPLPFCGASPVSHDKRIDSHTQGRMLLTCMLVSHSDIV